MSASDLFGDIRLGTRVIPSKYDVSITPALEAPFVFSGKVIITLELKEGAQPLKAIVCHALELEIEAADVALTREGADGKGVSHACTEVVFDVKTEQVAFLFGEGADLSAGAATLEIHNYKGVHNDKLAGFYRSKYTDSENKEKHTVVTQFEATDARRGLPCWDEPAFKAVFSVELTVPGHLWAISNMPEQSRLAVGHDKIKIRYYPSPIMSSYLLAFIVGEFDMIAGVVPATHTDTHQYNPCDIRVFTPVGKSDQGHFALDVAKKCLAFFNEFFQIPFPLPKLDLIAIADFAAGAMENWGAVTYRETRILIDADNTSFEVKQATARTICHEIAHMWFGNLVTMDWWTQLWLNEGFARFCEHLATDHIFPQWNMWTKFTKEVLAFALERDSKLSSHPIEVPVSHPDEVNSIFDAISYAKGGSVLRMIYNTIGHESFRDGVRSYLHEFQYKNAVTEDLWAHLNKFSGDVDVGALMDVYVKKMGYPVISVRQSEGKLLLSQERFIVTAEDVTEEQQAYRWDVPMQIATYDTQGDLLAVQKVVLSAETKELEVVLGEDSQGAAYVQCNYLACGFYRVHLQDSDAFLKPVVHSPVICQQDADAALVCISDTFALVQQGKMPPQAVVDLVNSFADVFADPTRINYWVLCALVDGICGFCAVHSGTDYYPKIQAWIGKVFGPAYKNRHSFGCDSFGMLRQAKILSVMAVSRDASVVGDCITMLHAHVAGEEAIPADFRGCVFNTAVRHGGRKEWDAVLGIYRATELSEEKRRCMLALGRNPDPELLSLTLDWGVVQDKEVRSQDVYLITASLAASAAGRALVWNWLTTQWSDFHSRFTAGFVKTYILDTVLRNFRTTEDADAIEEFFLQHPDQPAKEGEFPVAPITRALEGIRLSAARIQRERVFFEADEL